MCKAHCQDEEYQEDWWEEWEDSLLSLILGEEEESSVGGEDQMSLQLWLGTVASGAVLIHH